MDIPKKRVAADFDLQGNNLVNLGQGANAVPSLADRLALIQAWQAAGGRYRGAWAANTLYAQNDLILQGGSLLPALANFTSGAGFDATKWGTAIGGGASPGTGGPAAPQWVAGAQTGGALVFDAGIVYRVKQDIANGQTSPAGNLTSYLPLPPLDSPAFTGAPKAPTPATNDNSTAVATTAFVKSQPQPSTRPVVTAAIYNALVAGDYATTPGVLAGAAPAGSAPGMAVSDGKWKYDYLEVGASLTLTWIRTPLA